MRHKWMMLLVVLVTTVVTAQEAIKQYDDLKEQAGAWATSRLWASFLSTNAAEEESPQQSAIACSLKETIGDHSTQQEAWMPVQVNEVKSINNSQQQRAEAGHIVRIEIPALRDKQHNDVNPVGEAALERIGEVALLTEQTGLEIEEPSQLETQTTELDTAEGDEWDEHSIVHAEQQREVSRTLTRMAAQQTLLAVDAGGAPLNQTIVVPEARVQAKAIRKAIKALQDNVDRDRRIELRIIRRGRRADSQNATSMSLRAKNNSAASATTLTDALLHTEINSQLATGLSADGACASEE